ncbi:Phosphoglycerate mutase family protein, putative isoform 1 [Hibiscus syriacus]|uniref:Phosphoglycerate mutase family protein, putative isoform 1 n=1 Tax=Hibiscus syriacus TaxID=106335 RepID=A0A6A2XHT2_HIBSY|nr:Phosphoglycerate mutase family protein, putative isoform 1 [Hibiscus syriacus]
MNTSSAQFPYPWQRCKIIHLVRHGQAMHNVEGDEDRKALVCKLGKDVHASGLFKKIDLVITSPLYRTMQTAMGVFGSENQADGGNNGLNCPQIMAVELCRDRMMEKKTACGIRRSEEEMAARMVLFMEWLWTRPEQEIVIVSHGIILQKILYVLGNDCHPTIRSALCKRFGNCELRSVVNVDKRLREADSPLCSPTDVANLNVSRGEVSN